MKPLLIIPPAPARWPAIEDLLAHRGQPWIGDLQLRFQHGLPGAQDAFAVAPSNGSILGSAAINKAGDLGVLSHVYTRPEHRRRGWATRLLETVIAWFDMTGGKWLYLPTTAELEPATYQKFGFEPLHRAVWAPFDRTTMLRTARGVGPDPYADLSGPVTVRPLTRADWPVMIAVLQARPGPDPRVPIEESAVSADLFAFDLLNHRERERSVLLGAFQGPRLTGIATVATDHAGPRTYAMLVPHSGAPGALRAAAEAVAHEKGYERLDFPMETLDQLPAWAAAGKAEPEAGTGL